MTPGRASDRIVARSTKGATIFDSIASSPVDGIFDSGQMPGTGTYFCLGCGSQLSLRETDELPPCPRCGEGHFRRDSIFESRQDHGAVTTEFVVPIESGEPGWVEEARAGIERRGHHLAMRDDDGTVTIFPIERGWTRIGRSANADLRLDDPSVSRRHALIVAEPGKDLRVLDDRSLNGVLVNGEPVEWGALGDGDELTIGRYSLRVLRV